MCRGRGHASHHQPLFRGDRDTDLNAELVGLAGLALADAFHFGGVQGGELGLVLGLLGTDALGAFQPGGEFGLDGFGQIRKFAPEVALYPTHDGALHVSLSTFFRRTFFRRLNCLAWA